MTEFNTLSIVIPVYNEISTLEEILRRVLRVEIPLAKQLILVDDYSTDGTRDLYDKIRQAHSDVDVIIEMHDKNQGKGAALRTGFAAATGDIVLIQDADLEYDPRDYPRLLQPILEGKADVVYGSRFIGGQIGRAHV